MKNTVLKRIISAVLVAVLLIFPMPVRAEESPTGRFVLVVEAGGWLVVAPEYVSFTEGQNISEALAASRHTFSGLQNGQIYAIDGVAGNFTRSDQTGNYALDKLASQVTHYRFSENIGTSQPSKALQDLMTEMADYLLEDADVQAAAREKYETACREFIGAGDELAERLCADLKGAIADYQNNQSTVGTTVFSDGTNLYSKSNYNDVEIRLESKYGKVFSDDDGDGRITAPSGKYMFTISRNCDHIQGTVSIDSTETTVSAVFPLDTWLEQDSFLVSAGYGDDFENGKFAKESWEGRKLKVLVPDTFSGNLYTYAKFSNLSNTPKFTAQYTNHLSAEQEMELAFESRMKGPDRVLSKGAEGNTVVYRLTTEIGDYTVSQDYSVEFCRIPTLSGIRMVENTEKETDIAATEPFSSTKREYTYKVVNTVQSVRIFPVPTEPSYIVTVNGEPMSESGIEISVDGDTTVIVEVSGGGYSSTYTLDVQPGKGQNIQFNTTAKDITLEVTNSNGLVLPYTRFRDSSGFNSYLYTLVPGEQYYYVATRDEFFHTKDDFTLEDLAGNVTTVDVPVENWLRELAFGIQDGSSSKGTLALDTDFSAEDHTYALSVEDSESNVYAWVTGTDKNLTITAQYGQLSYSSSYHGKSNITGLTSGQGFGVKLNQFLVRNNPYGNVLTVRLSKEENGVTYYQDYEVTVERKLSLKSLLAFCGGSSVLLYQNDGETGYTPEERDYTLTVPMAADTLELNIQNHVRNTMNVCYGDEITGYRSFVKIGDEEAVEVPESGEVSLPLSGGLETETVTIEVVNDKTPGNSSEYILAVKKAAPTVVALTITPEDALFCVHERASGNRVWPENGSLLLSEGFVYDYALTRNGYVGWEGTFQVTRDSENALILMHNDNTIPVAEQDNAGLVQLTFEMMQAAKNEDINKDIPAQWPDFRGGSDNNGVTDAPVPVTADDGTLYWAIKLGTDFNSGAVGSPIIVDGDLITYAGDMIYRVDSVSGEILASGQMDHRSSFSITPPVYYEGMVFVALSDGSVQAFNAKTLESLWLYSDPLGGQPNCPIAVCDGYLYTGFWNSENVEANFVCMSVADEDPSQPKEKKVASWYYTSLGGYYWAGAYACSDYVLVGTDDGSPGYESQTSRLLLFDARSGCLLDSWNNLNGDVRSTVSYDSATDAFYFAAKGGTFYSVKVAKEEDQWKLMDKWYVTLSNNNMGGVPMSTSTPVVYNGRAYIGVSGAGQFSAYSGHNITVIDLNAKRIAYSVPTMGYPQTSGLLTTAYEENGYVYVYFVDNYTPGKIRVLRDKPGQTSGNYFTVDGTHSLAYDLFSPTGVQAQYAICSPIVDEYGTMYFKNDSGYLMAFGSMVEKLEVTKQPEKTDYMEGETFDPTGMEVIATLKNGKTRDVTKYVTWSSEALKTGDSEVTLVFLYVMYHNQENGNSMDIDVKTTQPATTVEITMAAFGPATEIRKVTAEIGKITVTFNGIANKDWHVFAAVYSNGKMLWIEEIEVTESVKLSASMTIPSGADYLKIFVLDKNGVPVMNYGELKIA